MCTEKETLGNIAIGNIHAWVHTVDTGERMLPMLIWGPDPVALEWTQIESRGQIQK